MTSSRLPSPTSSDESEGAAACGRRLDYASAYCGLPADYRVWGSPCSCDAVYRLKECQGHPVCERCAQELRALAIRVHRDRETTFSVARICSLTAAAS